MHAWRTLLIVQWSASSLARDAGHWASPLTKPGRTADSTPTWLEAQSHDPGTRLDAAAMGGGYSAPSERPTTSARVGGRDPAARDRPESLRRPAQPVVCF